MNIAFYAPMKSPNHPRPSGDRRIARLMIKALRHRGHQVELISELRSWEGTGDEAKQIEIEQSSEKEVERIISKFKKINPEKVPQLWFSYHLYHKAPDLIGPAVASTMCIPYVVAEASYSSKQKNGLWSRGFASVEAALNQAVAILCLNPKDMPALNKLYPIEDKIYRIFPFLDATEPRYYLKESAKKKMHRLYGLNQNLPWIIAVAMMRDDAKLVSYQYLVDCLQRLTEDFQFIVVGDGKARFKVKKLFSSLGSNSIFYTGQLNLEETMSALRSSDVFVWPAFNEAIGMAILEAQSCGLPMVVGDSGAVSDIVKDGESGYIVAPDDTKAMASRIDCLLKNPNIREAFSATAIRHFEQYHSLDAAACKIDSVLLYTI